MAAAPITLTGFSMTRPRREIPQADILEWLARAHAEAEAAAAGLDAAGRDRFADKIRHALSRCACRPAQIAARGVSVDDMEEGWDDSAIYDLRRHPHGRGTGARTRLQAERVRAYFDAEYARVEAPPHDLVHVTCTGYESPSAAQRTVAARGWGARTRVTHAYHMGCYAALPALRIAHGLLVAGAPRGARADVVHTELCSLHLDPTDHRLEQLVVQSLFGDGLIRYSAVTGAAPGLRLRAEREQILPDSADAMTWVVSDWGMAMTLSRDVPERIAGSLRGFVADLFRRGGLDLADAPRAVFAVHPGGPKIIDAVAAQLALDDAQVAHSRAVLHDYGNMSSATLPHIWMRIAEDAAIAPGTPIASLAFGPGLTLCGALFEKT
jgi:predicted naringenin-chalcone synthase